MNLFGKILTLIILILSLVFSVVAVMVGMNYKDWKSQASTLKNEVQDLEQLRQNLNDEKLKLEIDLKRERVSRARALAELQSRQLGLAQQLTEKEAQLAAEKQKAIESLSQSKEALARTAELDKQNETLLSENQQFALVVSKKVQDLSALQNQNYQIQGELAQKEERVKQLISRLANYSRIMAAYGLDEDTLTRHIEPVIDAEITEVSDDLVILNVGRDDGIRVGHEFDIYRGGRYLGQVQVTRLEGGNRVTARVTKKIAQIRVKDEVKTRSEVAVAPTTSEG